MTCSRAIILLAGFGSRLAPLTDSCHKALLKVGKQSILERQIHQLQQNQIQRLDFVLGHRAQEVKTFIENLKLFF